MDLRPFEKKIYSQNGEDGITIKLLELLYEDMCDNKYYVEFGVGDGLECNTKILREKYGWQGLQMDGYHEDVSTNLRKEYVTQENIVFLLKKYNVPNRINVLSVDIDYNDFYCLNKIMQNYVCDIVICEYNGGLLLTDDKVVPYDGSGCWNGSNYFGVSLLTLFKLGKKHGYTLIFCNYNGVNCFFVRDALLKERNVNILDMGDIDKLYRRALYGYGPNGGHPEDLSGRPYLTFEEALKQWP